MNDQHPHAGPVGYDTRSTGSFDTDPLFGSLPGGSDTADYAASGYDTSYGAQTGSYDSSAWDTGAQQTVTYDAYAAPAEHASAQQWDTGATPVWQQQPAEHDTTGQWATADTGAFPTAGFTTAAYGTAPYGTGAYEAESGTYESDGYDTGAYATAMYGTGTGTGTAYVTDGSYGTDAYGTGTYDTTAYATGAYDTGAYDTGTYDTGAYDATAWNTGATPGDAAYEPEQTSHQLYEQQTPEEGGTAEFPVIESELGTGHDSGLDSGLEAGREFGFEADHETAHEAGRGVGHEAGHEEGLAPEAATAPDDGGAPGPAPLSVDRTVVRAPAPRNRARRRSPAKRSALLTVAVPSACVMSVAGIAAASVSGISDDDKQEKTTSLAIADPSTVKPVAANNKLDSQLEQLSEGSDDFRQRASRTQERIDLKQRQVEEKKKREEEAARREALRPKFVLPVKQHGLSAYYGQAGVNWMSVHTGIDFPVGYGSPVMAATDGTVRTQYNSAYGNMAIVTMADGTETWYCHLSSTKIRSGPVKAGDVIAYAGSSGNSTGPHLHFEVRPGGGASVDPLAWLRSHGVDPT
ncbi:peptidoglycan DD-metalloendopeptidase family protein [Streptomyces sp. SID8374]|uniref:peptidoglycan DD-metalloendopeptidase family protein n=1 Tax=unclassified Streptomyces TaxID=2593676 RepID=UPI00081F6FC8|nr:peptidoglycan DD-metalloendopeptidase family protein [Streptomyces sp. ScaeMP-e83]MYR95807.1 peptidoglycan DD-metalloendopeptidase family protein [Streptomyces sp. SID4937]MYX16007.1 peptidoglycan DD-metalloendopeptidase family protein [Streptomyces sp. SID8374]SCD97659.1 Murein DD-endopeptidase MepM and murein hydrolase activator NlpD, contain LysM domain [Streptomyces sp. ScaeMP-e83]